MWVHVCQHLLKPTATRASTLTAPHSSPLLLTALSPYALNVCLIYVPYMYPLHDMYGLQETDTYGGG